MSNSRYAKILRARMRSKGTSGGAPLSLRELSARLGRSYEHCRSVLMGRPVASEDFNRDLCRVLGLDVDKMWRLARLEKARRRFGVRSGSLLAPPRDERMARLWGRLTDGDKERLIRIAEGLALAGETEARSRASRRGGLIAG